MKLLLDTHYLVWLTGLKSALTQTELNVIRDNEALASAVSLWELRIKWQLQDRAGNPKGPEDPDAIKRALHRLEMPIEPLTAQQACTVLEVPLDHRDPFDEQLLIQAQALGARLLTRDRRLVDHPLAYRSP